MVSRTQRGPAGSRRGPFSAAGGAHTAWRGRGKAGIAPSASKYIRRIRSAPRDRLGLLFCLLAHPWRTGRGNAGTARSASKYIPPTTHARSPPRDPQRSHVRGWRYRFQRRSARPRPERDTGRAMSATPPMAGHGSRDVGVQLRVVAVQKTTFNHSVIEPLAGRDHPAVVLGEGRDPDPVLL